jgi:hypothetical protein
MAGFQQRLNVTPLTKLKEQANNYRLNVNKPQELDLNHMILIPEASGL